MNTFDFGGRSEAEGEVAEGALLLQVLAEEAAGVGEIGPGSGGGESAGVDDVEGGHFFQFPARNWGGLGVYGRGRRHVIALR